MRPSRPPTRIEDEERRIDNLHSALSSREIIGQAQGILMERERIPADQAFDVLRRASQYLNIKLREVAQTLVDTGERPDTGPRDRRKGDKPGARRLGDAPAQEGSTDCRP